MPARLSHKVQRLSVSSPARRRSARRSVPIEGLITGDDVNRTFFEAFARAPRRSAIGNAVRGLEVATGLDEARPHIEMLTAAAHAHALREHPGEAAVALVALGRLAHTTTDPQMAHDAVLAGRQFAAAEAIEALLDSATAPGASYGALVLGLRFAGTEVAPAMVRRLVSAADVGTRRAYYDLALALAKFPEMRRALAAQLHFALGDPRWFAVRNSLVLLAGLKEAVPVEPLRRLASSPHRQVRQALVRLVAKLHGTTDVLDLLTTLLADEDPGVRYGAALGLARHANPRALAALRRAAETETDPETLEVCTTALARRPALAGTA